MQQQLPASFTDPRRTGTQSYYSARQEEIFMLVLFLVIYQR
jgi:hypothetical protein